MTLATTKVTKNVANAIWNKAVVNRKYRTQSLPCVLSLPTVICWCIRLVKDDGKAYNCSEKTTITKLQTTIDKSISELAGGGS